MSPVLRRIRDWWISDLPPMHGLLRFAFYAGLLLLAYGHSKSPVRGIWYYAQTDPELFRTFGLVELLGVPRLDPDVLLLVSRVTRIAWVFAAVGFLSRTSAVVTAAGVAFLHGIYLGPNALNHNWFLSVYALVALCFTRTNDGWSVDEQLRRLLLRRGFRLRERRPGLADTGLARKVFLVVTVAYYFAAGVSKLVVAGPEWTDGHTIAYFAAAQRIRLPTGFFRDLVIGHEWLWRLLGTSSLLLEIGAPLALLGSKTRLAFLVGWMGMHIGIRLVVGPKYWQNVLCLALLVDWGAAARAVRERLPEALRGLAGVPTRRASAGEPSLSHRRALAGVAAGTAVGLLFTGVACFQIFWWPVSHVYMYSSYFSVPRAIRADFPRADFHDAAAVQRIARHYRETDACIEATEHFVFLFQLRLAGERVEPRVLDDVPGVPTRKQWVLTVAREALIADFATKPAGRVGFDASAPDTPAQRLLRAYVPVLRRHARPEELAPYERLELTYPLETGPVVVASVSLGSASPPRAER